MRDFTLVIYRQLLTAFKEAGYSFITFSDYCSNIRPEKFIILRHDVDLKAENSLATAQLESSLGLKGSYYFRVVPQSDKAEVIKAIAALGHEIGYHYEDMSFFDGNPEKSIVHFEEKLKHFRSFYHVDTICMHGSPASSYDNRDLWKTYQYRDFGIIGEPYFDVDFDDVFYITDTGGCWDGDKYSVRDKVKSRFTEKYHHSEDIITALKQGSFPLRVMMTLHPQRWTDNLPAWLLEKGSQSIKNIIKQWILSRKGR